MSTYGPLGDFVYRRARYDTNCKHIAKDRSTRYRQIPIDQLIPLAFYTTASQLCKVGDLKPVVEIATQKYKDDAADFLGDWQRYCKVLEGTLQAEALYGILPYCCVSSIYGHLLTCSRRGSLYSLADHPRLGAATVVGRSRCPSSSLIEPAIMCPRSEIGEQPESKAQTAQC